MVKIVIMILCCCILALISQRRDENLSRRKFAEREQLFFAIMLCYMIVFAGLRIHFNDTDAYVSAFKRTERFPQILKSMEWVLGENPGFRLLTSLIRTFTDNINVYLMICSAIALFPTVWFVRKYTNNFFLTVFLFFMSGYYVFSLAAIKQTIATAFALIAIDRLLRGKKLRFVLLILLAMTVHPYCLLYFFAPLLMKQVPWRKSTWLVIVITAVASYSFNFLTDLILDVSDILGDNYDAENFVGDGINFFRVMVYFVPVVISFLWRKTFFEDSSKSENLFMNFTIIGAMIMFIGLFGNANMFSRLAMFFDPMIYIALPWMIKKLKGSLPGVVLSFGTYTAYPLFFSYQMLVASNFDYSFTSITLRQFLNSLFH